MTDDQLIQCIEDVVRLGNVVRWVNGLDQRAAARPAPDAGRVARFASQVGNAVPPSLLQLLRLHDGVACFDYVDVDIFSMDYLLAHQQALEEEWVDAGKFESGEIYVFGRSNHDSVALAFRLRGRGGDGEMPVVMFDARGVRAEYPSLVDYLQSRRGWLQEEVDRTQGEAEGSRDT